MIPSALSGQLQQGIADFLRFSFLSSTPGMESVIEEFLAERDGLLKGPYVSLKLPFVSGANPNFFPAVPMGFMPHLHQEQAFERLSGEARRSTLVATGTGSGKTESFLLPILDHCRASSGQRGVKAILIYPMNALATDQAGRIARLIHDNDSLRGRVRAGLYIGEGQGTKTDSAMGAKTIITDRTVMRDKPPDLLLTNYKMLDYLLLRPSDQGVWQHNTEGTLRFLVVDEIHTFDGAQGTDLACLIRRLKRRLLAEDGSLCCVGTSATLGGDEAGEALLEYAGQVFGESFDDAAVIGESRVSEATYLEGQDREWTDEPQVEDRTRLDPALGTDPTAWLRDQVQFWFGSVHEGDGDAWAVELGDRLKRHAAFQGLLAALSGETVDLTLLVERMAMQRARWRADQAFGRLALTSLLALVSFARGWRSELPEQALAREGRGDPRPVQPFLDVRFQLWQRELRRMVGSLSGSPRLRHSMDLDRDAAPRHLPMVHCRECGSLGWATLIQRDRPHLMGTDLDRFYRAFFANDPQVDFLYPAQAAPENDPSWPLAPFRIDVGSMMRLEEGEEPSGPVVRVVPAANTRTVSGESKLVRDCPFCMARGSLTLVGFRAASLTSVYIDQLFASTFNDDKKLLTFSDSVQDAAHRAGFFGARTWPTNLRIAMLRVVREVGPLSLNELGKTVGPWWRERLTESEWVSTFLAPSMAWLHDWGRLKSEGDLPTGSDLPDLIETRLGYETQLEFGLQARIGRSLPRTGAAVVAMDAARLDSAVKALLETVQNEVPGLRDIEATSLRQFVLGLLHHLRCQGGVLHDSIPEDYLASGGDKVYAFKLALALPAYTKTSRLPAFLTDRQGRGRFETWSRKGLGSWYDRWVLRCFGQGGALTADAASTYSVVLPGLVAAGLLRQCLGRNGQSIWGVAPEAALITLGSQGMACSACKDMRHVALDEADAWKGLPCLTAQCQGSYAETASTEEDYFSRLHAGGDLHRIFTDEHTGLLTRAERERVELEFKAQEGASDAALARRPWFANLLSCTPTLEMGIDIGDLSSTILCSVPPGQANYLQRIGRAGRRDGNSFVLTVAAGKPHDLYFFAEPEEMFAGEITPPGVFLDAPAVLERQLTAFCVDRWVAAKGKQAELPSQLRSVFTQLDAEGSARFPFNFLGFVKEHQEVLQQEFRGMFAETLSPDTGEHLQRYMSGSDDGKAGLRWTLLEAFHGEKKQRDSLAAKARSLREELKRLRELEAKSKDHEEELEELEREKDALLSLVAGINKHRTLEFMCDEGLLPNYAFPEAAISLKSVIWRMKKTPSESGRKSDTWSYEYRRSPASALSELAPGAEFYAGGRSVRIDRIDVGVSKPENWRFCTECNHGQSIDAGDELTSCPSCESGGWCDEGQKFRLLKLKQVFANTYDRDSRIRDDKDSRHPKYFQNQMMVDVKDEDRGGAWHVDDDRLPFGFEFLARATFREVNFGPPDDDGATSLIAGAEHARPGFHVCARCGKVKEERKDTIEHAFSCPSKKPGAKLEVEESLHLYREFASEAVRLLLPMTDDANTTQLNSFVAALQLGLKKTFRGSVDHLRTTVYSVPVEGSSLRRQYLVLFDTVPGGTGYIKQLVTPAAEGERIPLCQAIEAGLKALESCACWMDPERDGCYRCLFAYRNAREMADTSAFAASTLLRKILAAESKLKRIDSLGDVSINGLMDSVLEQRFIAALRLITDGSGKSAVLRHAVVNQKPGYRWTLGDAEWLVEPQVEPRVSSSSGIPVSIDFVMRPASAQDERRLAIFLDGWMYHSDRVGKDLRQRMALLAGPRWDVWTFTWSDLDQKFGMPSKGKVLELAVTDRTKLRALMQKAGSGAAVDVINGSVFDWFEAEITGTGLKWGAIATCVLAARMSVAGPKDTASWMAHVNELVPPAAREALRAMEPRQVMSDTGAINPYFRMMAIHDGSQPALICSLDDRAEVQASPEYKAAWRGYLRLFQLLRQAPNAWFMTGTALDDGADYGSIGAGTGDWGSSPSWPGMGDIEPEYLAVARALAEAGVSEPEIGLDVPDVRGDAWAQAELVWEAERVAVSARTIVDDARGEPAADWVVLFVEDLSESVDAVLTALKRDEVS